MRRSIIYLFLPLVTCTPVLLFGMEEKRIPPYILGDPTSIPAKLHDKIYFDQLEWNLHNPIITVPYLIDLWSVNSGIRTLVEKKSQQLFKDSFTPRALYTYYTATGTGFSSTDMCDLLPAKSFAQTIQNHAKTLYNHIQASTTPYTNDLVTILDKYYTQTLQSNKKFAQFVCSHTWTISSTHPLAINEHKKASGLFSLLGLAIMHKQYHTACKLIQLGAPIDRCRIQSSYGRNFPTDIYYGAHEFLLTLLECHDFEERRFPTGSIGITINQKAHYYLQKLNKKNSADLNDFLTSEDAESCHVDKNKFPVIRSKGLYALMQTFIQNGIDISWQSEKGFNIKNSLARQCYRNYLDTTDAQNYLAYPDNSTKTTEHAHAIKTIFADNNNDIAQAIIQTTPTPQRFWLRLCNNTDFGFKIFGTQNWPDRLANLIDQNLIDPNLPDINGNTLLHLAAFDQEKAKKKLVKILFAPERLRKPNVNARDRNGNTALYYAVQSQNAQLIRLLLQRGADPSINKPEWDYYFFEKLLTTKLQASCNRVDLVRNYLVGIQESKYLTRDPGHIKNLLKIVCWEDGIYSTSIGRALEQGNYHLLDTLLNFGAPATEDDLSLAKKLNLAKEFKNRLKEAMREQK